MGLLRHFYKSVLFALKFGERAIRKSFREQLGVLKKDADLLSHSHSYPTMIGEIGIPFDMKKTKPRVKRGVRSKTWNADYKSQSKALDVSLGACDGANCLSYTSWSYVSTNTHEWGDGWNGEDLSIWSKDDTSGGGSGSNSNSKLSMAGQEDTSLMPLVNSNGGSSISSSTSGSTDYLDGCRAPEAFIRPYIEYTVGLPLSMDYSIARRKFEVRVGCGGVQTDVNGVTEVFIPRYFFTNPHIQVSEGSYEVVQDKVYWKYDVSNKCDKTIVVTDSPNTQQHRPHPPQRSFSQSFIDILSSIVRRFM